MRNARQLTFSLLFVSLVPVSLVGASSFVLENPATGSPESVWTHSGAGGAWDVRYSYLEGEDWSLPATLSSIGRDGSGPVLAFTAGGDRRVVWGTSETIDRILLRTQPVSGGSWSTALVVSDSAEVSCQPSAAVFNGSTFVSYETVSSSGTRSVKVAKADPGSNVERSLVRATSSTSPVHTRIHAEGGHLWVDWIDSSSNLGFSVWGNGSWGSIYYESYGNPAQIDAGLASIRLQVLDE